MEVIIDFPGGSKADAHFAPFTVRADQPPEHSGLSSFDEFCSSIGTCLKGLCLSGPADNNKDRTLGAY